MINISNKLNIANVNSNNVNFKGNAPQKAVSEIANTAIDSLRSSVAEFGKMKKLVIINGSPRPDSISNTYKALMAETEYYKNKFPELETAYFKLPKDMNGCFNCKTCIPRCVQKNDNLNEIIDAMEDASDVMLKSCVFRYANPADSCIFDQIKLYGRKYRPQILCRQSNPSGKYSIL